MALRNTGTAPAPTPAFEAEESDTTVMDAAPPNLPPKAEPQAAAAAPAPKPQTPLAVRSENAVSPLSARTAMKSLEWVIPAEDLEAMGIGTFPRITVGLDGFSEDKTKEYGKKIELQVLSWNQVYLVTTSEQNNPEANKLIRTSYDGINLKGGEGTVVDYIKQLKLDGYDGATAKKYVELYGQLLAYTNAKGERVEVPEDEQGLVQVSLSPQSVSQWLRYNLECGLRLAKGITSDTRVVLTQERKVLGSNKFGIATFSPKW